MADISVRKLNVTFAPTGEQGQKCLISGQDLGMRLWENEPPGPPKPVTRRDYETLGYVLSGRAELQIEGERLTLEPGDSWVVPRGSAHAYTILEPFTALEATSPPSPSTP